MNPYIKNSPGPIRKKILLIWIIFLVCLGLYWLQLAITHRTHVQEVEQQAKLRANQLSEALSLQTDYQLRKLNFVLEHLGKHWWGESYSAGQDELNSIVRQAQNSLPNGAILRIFVADRAGQVKYNFDGEHNNSGPEAVSDQDYFKAQISSTTPALFISKPTLDKGLQRWVVNLSRPVYDGNQLAYVIALSVAVEHLAESYRRVFPDPSDVVVLLADDGQYITRNHALLQAMGTYVSADRDFLTKPELDQGQYEAAALLDGVTRYYSWRRIPNYPLILSLGLGKDKIMSPVVHSLKYSHVQNAIATALLIIAALWITRLAMVRSKQELLMQQTLLSLEKQHLRLVSLLDEYTAGVLLLDENDMIVIINQKCCDLLRLNKKPSELRGKSQQYLQNLLDTECRGWLGSELPSQQHHDARHNRHLMVDRLRINASVGYLGQIWLIRDISQRVQKEQKLTTMANTDALTGLLNRRSFMSELNDYLAQYGSKQAHGALLMLDLDHFKRVNDTYGHPVGDLVLKQVAQIMQQNIRADDHTGRIGGEEFAILLRQTDMPQAMDLAERIRASIEKTRIITDSADIFITISIGVAPLTNINAEDALIQADQALYQAKSSGRNQVCQAALQST